jgi:HTH-type transcriptional regulator, competence development regulator
MTAPTSPAPSFGAFLRATREQLQDTDKSAFTLRQVALRADIEPAYLSKIERDEATPPSEATIVRIAVELNQDPDMLLAMAGKVSMELQAVIRQRPQLFASLLRELKSAPDHALLRLVREVRDGTW